MYLWCTLHSGLKTQWMLANLMIIVVSLYHFGYSLLMICMVSWSNVTSFLNESLVAPKRLFEKKKTTSRDSEKNLFYRKCEIMRLTHFRIEYSGSSPQLKPHTSQRSSSEKLYVFQKQFSCHCALRKSRWVMCLSFFCKIDYFTFLCERNIDKV